MVLSLKNKYTCQFFSLFLVILLFPLAGFGGEEGPCPESPQNTPSAPSTPADSGPSNSSVSTPSSGTEGSTKEHLGSTFDPSQRGIGDSSGGTLGMKSGGGGNKNTFGPSDFMSLLRSYITTAMQQIDKKERSLLEKKWKKESGLNEAVEGREKAWKEVLKASGDLKKVDWHVRHNERWYNEYKQYENNPNATNGQRTEADAARHSLESAQKDPEYQKAKATLDATKAKLEQTNQAVDKAMNNFGRLQTDYQNQKDAGRAGIPPVQ